MESKAHETVSSCSEDSESSLSVEDACSYFAERTNSLRRRGVLSVRSIQESLSNENKDHVEQARKSRLESRLRLHGKSPDDFSVRFGTVVVREYPIILGDNPGASAGPPLSIDWQHNAEYTIDMDVFEEQRPERREMAELRMPSDVRSSILHNAGYSRKEIVELLRPINISRRERRTTANTLHLQPIQELLEKLLRKIKNIITLGAYKRKAKALVLAYRCTDRAENAHQSKNSVSSTTKTIHSADI